LLHVDYIDNFETKALDVLRDLSAEAWRISLLFNLKFEIFYFATRES
jgi:hypothetical protein